MLRITVQKYSRHSSYLTETPSLSPGADRGMNILLWFLERKHVGLPGNHFGSDAGFGSRLTIVRQSSIEHGSRQSTVHLSRPVLDRAGLQSNHAIASMELVKPPFLLLCGMLSVSGTDELSIPSPSSWSPGPPQLSHLVLSLL